MGAKKYSKPAVKKVNLVAEEAVLSACKKFMGDAAGKVAKSKVCGDKACQTTFGS